MAQREAGWYRAEANRIRTLARQDPHVELSDSFFELAEAYDKLAGTLERTRYKFDDSVPGL
jgi:hypothetical protein